MKVAGSVQYIENYAEFFTKIKWVNKNYIYFLAE